MRHKPPGGILLRKARLRKKADSVLIAKTRLFAKRHYPSLLAYAKRNLPVTTEALLLGNDFPALLNSVADILERLTSK